MEQDSWDKPVLTDWLQRFDEVLHQQHHPVILIAHSLAVSLVMHWVNLNPDSPGIAGAFLVAPADVDSLDHTPEETWNFSPIPTNKVPFPSVLIASEDDAYISIQRAAYLASQWGSEFISVGKRDHIGTAAKLGMWHEGQLLFEDFVNKLK